MDIYSELTRYAESQIPESERLPKRFSEEVRRAGAARLTSYMQTMRPFSFLRLGDMELGLLLADQEGKDPGWATSPMNETISVHLVWGHPGLGIAQAQRLRRAYEHATYVDFHERWWVNRALNPLLKLNRLPPALRNQGEADSHIFMDWLRYEFRGYVSGRRCLFAGAEAGVLAELWKRAEYREVGKIFWPPDAQVAFLAIESRLPENLDDLKASIAETVIREKSDTLFLSLGGGAKILCAELAEELGICAFDFGGLMRGLCYMGSDGHSFSRSTHHPFYFRVPFNLFMDAYEASHPNLPPEKLLVKAQCQVMLDSATHDMGDSLPTFAFAARLQDFQQLRLSLHDYRRRYGTLEKTNLQTRRVAREFRALMTELVHGRKSWPSLWVRIRNKLERTLHE